MKAKKIILFLSILIFLGGFIAYKMYNKPHVNVGETSSDVTLEAAKIVDDFSSDETLANTTYLDKIVQVLGIINSIKAENETVIVALAGNGFGDVLCYLSEESKTKVNTLKEGQQVALKGICTGFLLDVVLVKCVLIN
ncbi:hypothetical protein BST83_09810 [Polaribacter filamentus]|uniref:tRNA_anti-like n=1 Tax=Polaribacter filamentus TaxID=53483 RepID=A0A2S7KY42_9FLAO|nr:hypothetical protein [Polaribacter filamentus]PQB07423.1 hypothetical protein BST83_09810 [Polaribacter filamentus]